MAFSIDFKILKFSIVNVLEDVENKKDLSEPYSFVDFVKNLDIDNNDNSFIVDIYNRYILEWTKIKNQASTSFEEIRKQKYVDLLKTIQLNFITQDEQRILGDIDYENPLELDVAIPFFVEKIKDVIHYYTTKRRDVKNSKAKWSTKGSKQFLETFVSEYIIDNYIKTANTFQSYKQTYQELSSFQGNYELEYDGLYDLNDYRGVEFTFDTSTFLSSGDSYELSSLPLSGFTDYTSSSSTLISELKKDLYRKYISTDHTYYNNGTGLDIVSTTPFYDPYNYETPYISRIADDTNLLRDKDIGYYFTSKYIYTSNYFSPLGISTKDTSEFTGLLPTINQYRGEDYSDYYFWSKYSSVNQGLAGKPIITRRLKRFHGYQSRDMDIGDSVGGVERYTDNVQLWTGDTHETWANDDIFDKFTDNILNRAEKTEYFFNLNEGESVYKYCCDIWGNQYYLIKDQAQATTAQSNIYTLPTSIASDVVSINSFTLLGQRSDAISALSSIQIQSNVALGFFINPSAFANSVITNITDFNVDEFTYNTLDSTLFDTTTLSITSDSIAEYKSLYENHFTSGRLVIRGSNSKVIGQLSSFIDDVFEVGLYEDLNNNLLNIDVINDVIIFTTPTYTITAKVQYNYATSTLTFNEILKNKISQYNTPLNKSASYWHTTKNDAVYFANLSANESETYPDIYKLEVVENDLIQYSIDTPSATTYDLNNIISIDTISKPCIIRDSNSLYIVDLLKDICNNYYYQLYKYDILSKNTINLVYNRLYQPDWLKLNSSVLTDSLAISSIPSATIATISSIIDDNVVFMESSTYAISSYALSTFSTESVQYYDNDFGALSSLERPNFYYTLSETVSSVTPVSTLTTEEDSYFYETDMPPLYSPSDIVLDFRNLANLSSYIDPTEPIYKIEYLLGPNLITKHILSQGDIADDYFNTTFLLSPINMEPLTYNNKDGNSFSILFYSANDKKYRFEFSFGSIKLAMSDLFSKVELLDARITTSANDEKSMVIYMNGRAPDYVITNTIINI